MSREPKPFRRGKLFEREVQADWEATAQGAVHTECTIPLLQKECKNGRQPRGRMDIFIDDIGDNQVAIVEIKSTNWDRIKPQNVTKNLGSHRRQIYKYIEEYLDGKGITVCPGLIYPEEPKSPGLKERIEEYLNSYGIMVAWHRD